MLENYLHDLRVVKSIDEKLDESKIEDYKKLLQTRKAKEYLELLPRSKPEIVLSEYLFRPILECLKLSWQT
ncbi:hypothetical protein [Archaeoglobus sp.]